MESTVYSKNQSCEKIKQLNSRTGQNHILLLQMYFVKLLKCSVILFVLISMCIFTFSLHSCYIWWPLYAFTLAVYFLKDHMKLNNSNNYCKEKCCYIGHRHHLKGELPLFSKQWTFNCMFRIYIAAHLYYTEPWLMHPTSNPCSYCISQKWNVNLQSMHTPLPQVSTVTLSRGFPSKQTNSRQFTKTQKTTARVVINNCSFIDY